MGLQCCHVDDPSALTVAERGSRAWRPDHATLLTGTEVSVLSGRPGFFSDWRADGRRIAFEFRSGRFAVGDAVVARRNSAGLKVINGERGTVVSADCDGIRLDLRGEVTSLPRWFLDRDGPATVQHAYAITGHVAQGMTLDRAFVLGSEALYREWGYTALSRGRVGNRLYISAPIDVDRKEIAPRAPIAVPVDALVRSLQATRAQTVATDAVQDQELRRLPTSGLRARSAALRERLAAPEIAGARRHRDALSNRLAGAKRNEQRAIEWRSRLAATLPPLHHVGQRREHRRRMREVETAIATAGVDIVELSRQLETAGKQIASREQTWIKTHGDGLAERRAVEEELRRGLTIEQSISRRNATGRSRQ